MRLDKFDMDEVCFVCLQYMQNVCFIRDNWTLNVVSDSFTSDQWRSLTVWFMLHVHAPCTLMYWAEAELLRIAQIIITEEGFSKTRSALTDFKCFYALLMGWRQREGRTTKIDLRYEYVCQIIVLEYHLYICTPSLYKIAHLWF